ncbi:hypothetical protein Pcinc_008196 [Petrolisthes cinctipes]|uniref:Peptidase A2 domain-containing protein n=1 Tax=Petrolisthes cinctipes TaxID=88211 RepID=A0AAE1G9D5_PETCI|nr:hypothetical protein Pcinc_008196 [Petrolisthes cinctipes]
MLPDTGADVTIIGEKHMSTLQVSRSSLQPLPSNTVLTADGSEMSPALGYFQATLQLGKKWCTARIQVHKGVPTLLLSYSHCKELNIIPQEFPKPIQQIQHVNRCTETPLCNITSPSEARKYFLRTFKEVLVSKEDTLQSAPQDNDRTLQDIRESAREDSEYAHLLHLCNETGYVIWQRHITPPHLAISLQAARPRVPSRESRRPLTRTLYVLWSPICSA